MIGRVPRCLLVVGIVTAASACDNVSWGGFDLSLQGPSADTLTPPSPGEEEPSPEGVDTPLPPTVALAPLLYAGAREGDSAWVVPSDVVALVARQDNVLLGRYSEARLVGLALWTLLAFRLWRESG